MSRGHKSGHNEPMEDTLAGLAGAAAESILIAMGNYASIVDANPTNTAAAPVSTVIAAIILKPEVSGIFRIDADVGYGDSVSEDVTWQLLAAEPAVPATPITLANGTPAAIFGKTAATGSEGEVEASGTGIVITGAGAPVILNDNIIDSTSAVDQTQGYHVSGLFSFSGMGTTKTPFTLGETAVLYLAVSAPAGVIQNMVVQFSAQEQPST